MNQSNKRYSLKVSTDDQTVSVLDSEDTLSVVVVVHISPALPYYTAHTLAKRSCDTLNDAYDAAVKIFSEK